MKIANSVTYLIGRYQHQQMIVRPYKLTHEGARRILQAEVNERCEGEPAPRISVERISYAMIAKN